MRLLQRHSVLGGSSRKDTQRAVLFTMWTEGCPWQPSAPSVGGPGLIPGPGTKTLHMVQLSPINTPFPTPPAPCQKRNLKMSYLLMGEIQRHPEPNGKVALDGPLLNSLKEKPRLILVKRPRGLPPFLNRRESRLNTRPFLSTEAASAPPGMLKVPKRPQDTH